MEQVSRDKAKAVLGELVGALDQLERVNTISEIYINPNFDSVLEARFIESLKRLGGVGSIPMVKLVQDVVNGKSGFVLEVGHQRYRVESQGEVGDEQGVLAASRPDFVIWPWAAGSKRRPVAVFCDGWAYHKDTTDEIRRQAVALLQGCEIDDLDDGHDETKRYKSLLLSILRSLGGSQDRRPYHPHPRSHHAATRTARGHHCRCRAGPGGCPAITTKTIAFCA